MQTAVRRSLQAGLLLICALAGGAAQAELSIKKSTRTYEVKGGTAAELYEQMETLGPRQPRSSYRHWARTKWDISWQLRFAKQGRSCVVDLVWTELTLEPTFPLWTDKTGASPALKSSWGTAMRELEVHEKEHADMAKETAKQIDHAFQNLGLSINCPKLGRRANEVAKALMKELRERDKAFDRDTDHGRKTIPLLRD